MAKTTIPIARAEGPEMDACAGGECFALRVLGDSMAPEFVEGEVIVVEPEGLATDGAYVVAHAEGQWTLRQLIAREGQWTLRALDARYPPIDIPDLACVRGVVIQKSIPGRRRAARRYGS